MAVQITYFVHGTTTDNEKGLATGWNPGELSELGKRQIEGFTKLVATKQFNAVFSSDLKRAIESAELTFGNRYKVIKDERLRECDYGNFTGKPAAAFKNDMLRYVDTPFPDGESYKDVENRIADFLQVLHEQYDGKHIAIVAHQAPQLALDVLLKGKSWKQAIDEDWRKTGAWQPGWEYKLS